MAFWYSKPALCAVLGHRSLAEAGDGNGGALGQGEEELAADAIAVPLRNGERDGAYSNFLS